MLESVKQRGLCSTCTNNPSCIFPIHAKRPVVYCEEFECDEAPSKKTARSVPLKSESRAEQEKNVSHYTGLCSDCENRQTCMYSKPEAGVWHCEGYR